MGVGPEFYQTPMGRRFFESTVPNLVKQLELLNENFTKINELTKEVAILNDRMDRLSRTEEHKQNGIILDKDDGLDMDR